MSQSNKAQTSTKMKKSIPDEKVSPHLIQRKFVWLLIGLLIALKSSLVRSYTSTDFEVHRNWMSLTYNLPLKDWYYSNISIWTLDYPPFFSYFEKSLSTVAAFYNKSILTLQEEPLFNNDVLIFQRVSVIVTDFLYFIAAIFLSESIIETLEWGKASLKHRLKLGLFVLMAFNPGLILLDNIHFQYNSMLYGLLCLAISAIQRDSPITGALIFAILLNFKHIFLYYVPAFVLYFAFKYILPFNREIVRRVFNLGVAVLTPVILSFGPFMYQGGFEAFQQILSRLFPFKRGLTHSYWAPNFWAIYNFYDYALYKLLKLFKLQTYCQTWFENCGKYAPTYTSGLVEEYEHSVLPNITPPLTLVFIGIYLLPLFLLYVSNVKEKFLVSIILSAYSFYLFGWHVHEKAILMVSIPMTLLVFKNLKYKDVFLLLSTTAHASLFPLLFTPLENLVKYCLVLAYFVLNIYIFFYCYRLKAGHLVVGFNKSFFLLLIGLEVYKTSIHHIVFGSSLEFLPLMLTSLICSIGVMHSYFNFLYVTFFEDFIVKSAKIKCLKREQKIKDSVEKISNLDSIHYIGGIDISICTTVPDIAIISYSVMEYPGLEPVFTDDQVVYLPVPYIPEYLIIREAEALVEIVLKNSHIPVDVLLIDGNGRFHSRRCGLATHVGYLTGIPTIGVSKSFLSSVIINDGFPKEEVNCLENKIHEKCRALKNAAILSIDGIDADLVRIVRPESSVNPLYVSSGYMVDLETATTMVIKCLRESIPEPIRLCDLRSRALVDKFFNV